MNCALIGRGYWGSKILKYLPEKFNVLHIADSKYDLQKIWNDDRVKCVFIITPIETHYFLAKDALNNNKHVFIEKPITLSYDKAIKLKNLSLANKLVLMVDYVQQFSEAVVKSQLLINEIGDVEYIEMISRHLGRFMNHDVYILLSSHLLSILDLFYDLDKLNFKFKNHIYRNGLCTTGSIEFDFGIINVSTNYPDKEFRFNIYGSEGTLKCNFLNNPPLKITKYKSIPNLLPYDLEYSIAPYFSDETNNIRNALNKFYNLVSNNNITGTNLDTALKITKILENRNA